MAPMYRKGDHTITVSGAELEAQYSKSGYDVVEPEPAPEDEPVVFDPAEHSVAEVTAYLDGLDGTDSHRAPCVDGDVCGEPAQCPPSEARVAEIDRVLEAERNGKNRSTLVGAPQDPPVA